MKSSLWITGLLILANAGGCGTMNNTQAGATGGGILGGIFGMAAGVAASPRNPLLGAAIGGTAGAVGGATIGGLAGNAQDRAEQKRAEDIARFQANIRYALEHPAVPPEQVADMTRKHVADDNIIELIRSTRTLYQLTPEWITWLKSQGVSDRVILYMQQTLAMATAPRPGYVVVQPPPPSGVIVVGGGYRGWR